MSAALLPVSAAGILAPLGLTAGAGLLCLGAEPFVAGERKHALLPWLGVSTLLVALAALLLGAGGGAGSVAGGVLVIDGARYWMAAAVIAITAFCLGGLQHSLRRDGFAGGEPYALTCLAGTGALVMVFAADLLALFVGMELLSLSVYAVVGTRRHRAESNEGLLKYFVMGAVFSAIFLYGVALTYGATGSTRLGAMPVVSALGAGAPKLWLVGQGLLLIGLLFKVGAAPFHFWSPDAYTGAPAAVTGFMAAVVKLGAFCAFGTVWANAALVLSGTALPDSGFHDLSAPLSIASSPQLAALSALLLGLGLLSLLLGNFSALGQTHVRRVVAFSSVAHAGYLLLALLPAAVDGRPLNLGGLWVYLASYAVASAGLMVALCVMAGPEDDDEIVRLGGAARRSPLAGLVATLCLASLAGVPPLVGFVGKYLVFAELVAGGRLAPTLVAMVLAVVGAIYYWRLVITLWAAPAGAAQSAAPQRSHGSLAGLSLAVVGCLCLGLLAVVPLLYRNGPGAVAAHSSQPGPIEAAGSGAAPASSIR